VIRYQIIFFANFFVTYFVMKLLSWFLSPRNRHGSLPRFLFLSPYFSVRSEHSHTKVRYYSLFGNFLLHATLMGLFLVVGHEFLAPLTYFKTILIAPAIYFFTEAAGSLAQLIFSWRNQAIFPIHHHPLTSPSLSQFWGRRWNLWVQDWLKDISSAMGRTSRPIKIVTTFLVSGIFHEVLVNLPFWLMTGRSYFGTMLGYFVIQAIGVYIDKKVFRHAGFWPRVLFQWFVIVLPSPLFVNVPILSFFGVTNPFD
jgi:hypothetical protein